MQTEINECLNVLKKGGIILYPTDTVWGIGCDATSESAVNKIYKIKQRSESKSLIILVDSIKMLQQYVPTIPNKIIELLGKDSNPTTIILAASTLPFLVKLANKGYQKALGEDKNFLAGLNVHKGHVTYKAVADVFGHSYVSPEEAIKI